MNDILNDIKAHGLINAGDKIAVACSGGKDSMSLLHFLWSNRETLGCQVVAVNVDHGLRENSASDSEFVANFCAKNNIKVYSFKVNAKQFAEDKKLTIEQGARECRYRVFKSLVNKGIVNKVALAHHMQDQAETVLLNLFRGTSIAGASGMDYMRDDIYIRPLLNTPRAVISAYIATNEIPYVEDETNNDIDFSRNYIRNRVMPIIRSRWNSVDQAICHFADSCRRDEQYIQSGISDEAMVIEEGIARIYTTYFVYPEAYVYRLLMRALKAIGLNNNIESKHLKLIRDMAIESENGTKINLPNGLSVIKEYNFVTITNKNSKPSDKTFEFKRGKQDFSNFGLVETTVLRAPNIEEYTHTIDIRKVPKDALWRYRRDGDVFEKFGGGTTSLSDYLIDKKIPVRLRNLTPVLASGNEILIIAGVEISDKVKVDKDTQNVYAINVVKF